MQAWCSEIGRTAAAGTIVGALAFAPLASAEEAVRGLESKADAAQSTAINPDDASLPAIAENHALRKFDRQKRGAVQASIPASVLQSLSDKATSSRRKVSFIRATLPLVLHANDLIMRDRLRIELLQIYDVAGLALPANETSWLTLVAKKYGAASAVSIDGVDFETLLGRVDIVPPSLALAQAAEESGWGSSRFARQGNALFGQRIYRGVGGIVPEERAEGETYRVRSFDRVIDGVRAYLHNLNTHYAYQSFRVRRAAMRRESGTLDGYGLTMTLLNYSERRESYLRSIRSIMRHNGLSVLDQLQPRSGKASRPDT